MRIRENANLPKSTSLPKLYEQIEHIVSALPHIKYSRLASGEIDYYGASNNISRSLGLDGIPYTRSSWFHGWLPYPLVFPELIVTKQSTICCDVNDVSNLVTTKKQEEFLKENGFPHAKATGAPFIYTQDPSVKRIPGSLLLIPEHSIRESNQNYEKNNGSTLLKAIDRLKCNFSLVVSCIGGFCVQKKNYIETFEKAGIPWITGAWLHDAFGLQRIRNLFSQFEFVATNSIGSHIPYAGYCGCKVSYHGLGHDRQPEYYREIPLYSRYPKLIELVNKEQNLNRLLEKYSFLFKNVENSEQIQNWSREALGFENMLPAFQIAELVGWKIRPKEESTWEYIPGENPGLDDHIIG